MELSIKSFRMGEIGIKYCHQDDHFLEALYLAKGRFDTIDTKSFEVQNYINEMKARYTNEYGVLNRANLILDELENATNYYKDSSNFNPSEIKDYYAVMGQGWVTEYFKSFEDWSNHHIDITWNRFYKTGLLQSANDTLDLYAIYEAYISVGDKKPDIEGLRWWYNVLPTDANGSKVGNVFDMNDPIQAALINGLWNDKFTPEKIKDYHDTYGENAKYFLDINENNVTVSSVLDNTVNILGSIDYQNPYTGKVYKNYLLDNGMTNLQKDMKFITSGIEWTSEQLQIADQAPDNAMMTSMKLLGANIDFSEIFPDANLI